jgi:hypothetical protein
LERIVCAAVLDTFFLSSITSFEKTSLIGTVRRNAALKLELAFLASNNFA